MTEPEVKMALAKLTSSELSIDDKVLVIWLGRGERGSFPPFL